MDTVFWIWAVSDRESISFWKRVDPVTFPDAVACHSDFFSLSSKQVHARARTHAPTRKATLPHKSSKTTFHILKQKNLNIFFNYFVKNRPKLRPNGFQMVPWRRLGQVLAPNIRKIRNPVYVLKKSHQIYWRLEPPGPPRSSQKMPKWSQNRSQFFIFS